MGEQLPIGRSPRPWRDPRTRDDRIGGASRPAALIALALPLPLAILAGTLTGVPY